MKDLTQELEKVQVDCTKLTTEQFDKLVNLLKDLGFTVFNEETDLEISEMFSHLQVNGDYFIVYFFEEERETISYEEFIKRFS